MNKPAADIDDVLKKLGAETVKQGEDLRAAVRDLTLKALQARELSLSQIKCTLKSIAEGVNHGAVEAKLDLEQVCTDALAGMDDALHKAAQASRVALEQITRRGQQFEYSSLKKTLDDLEKLENEFLNTLMGVAESANREAKERWGDVLGQAREKGTKTGAQVEAILRQFGKQWHTAMCEQREMGFRVAHTLSQQFATLASGVLIGLSEGFQPKISGTRKAGTKTQSRNRRS